MSQPKYNIPSLNGFRAISIIMVIGSHATLSANFPESVKYFWTFIFNGSLGVNTFFVLSGFLITHLLIREELTKSRISLKKFYLRRIFRIFPVYYTLLLVYFLLQHYKVLFFTNAQWIASLTYTRNFVTGNWEDGHLWSLAVEEQFYIIWPLVFYFFSDKKRKLFALGVILSSPIIRAITYKTWGPDYIAYSSFTNFDAIMWGCVAALYLNEIKSFISSLHIHKIRLIFILPIFTIIWLEKLLLLGVLTVPFGKSINSICIIILIISYSQYPVGIIYKFLNLRLINWIGILSYSLYIWQQIFFSKNIGKLQLLPFNLFLIFFTAIISYYFLEKPILKFKEKFT